MSTSTTTCRKRKSPTKRTRRKLSRIGKTKIGALNNNFKGWWEIDSIRHESLQIAEIASGVKAATLRKRCFSENFLNYRFIPKESLNG